MIEPFDTGTVFISISIGVIRGGTITVSSFERQPLNVTVSDAQIIQSNILKRFIIIPLFINQY